jgi:hypothetical protein
MAKQKCPVCGGRGRMAANVNGQWMGGPCLHCKGTGEIETGLLGSLFNNGSKTKQSFRFYDDFRVQQTIQNMKRAISLIENSAKTNSKSSLSMLCQEWRNLAHYYQGYWDEWLEYNDVNDVKDFKRKKRMLNSQKEWQIGEEALNCFSKALNIAYQISDSHEIAHCELWVGTCKMYIQNPNTGRDHLNKALKLFEEQRDREKITYTKSLIGYSYDL